MAQVKIVTDSNAFLPDPDAVDRLGIEVIPLPVQIGSRTYREGIDVPEDAFLAALDENPSNVSVGAPAASELVSVFRRIGRATDRIVCVHTSAALNDVAEVARAASAEFLGRQRIVVLDTASASAGLGLIVQTAAESAAAGAPQAEVIRIVRGMIPHLYALFFSDSLDYLEAWGRLGSAQTLLGTMLGLKPLSTMEDGDLLPIEKVREYAHALDKLEEFVIEFSHIEQMYVVQRGFEAEAAQLLERMGQTHPGREFPVISYPPSLAVHLGPRALGVLVYEGVR